jgi:hypothetical protein
MIDVLKDSPWLLIPILALLIPIFGTTTNYLTRVRQAELEAALKQDMLQRGMSAEEIKMVIEASAHRKGKSCRPESASRQEIS